MIFKAIKKLSVCMCGGEGGELPISARFQDRAVPLIFDGSSCQLRNTDFEEDCSI